MSGTESVLPRGLLLQNNRRHEWDGAIASSILFFFPRRSKIKIENIQPTQSWLFSINTAGLFLIRLARTTCRRLIKKVHVITTEGCHYGTLRTENWKRCCTDLLDIDLNTLSDLSAKGTRTCQDTPFNEELAEQAQ